MQYFTILKYKLHSFNIQDDLSMRGLLAKPLKKTFQNHLYGQPVASCGVFEWTLIELRFNIIKNLSCLFLFIFYLKWFYNDVQSSEAFDTHGVLSTPASDVHERLKTNGTVIKIKRETTDNPKKKYNLVKHIQKWQFSFTKTSIKVSLQAEIENLKTRLLEEQEKIITLKNYSRRKNLRFMNVPEHNDENCMDVVDDIIENDININVEDIHVLAVHRVGKPR